MKSINTIICFLLLTAFTSCGGNEDKTAGTETSLANPTDTSLKNNSTNTIQLPTATTATAATTGNLPAAPLINTGGGKLNPEHGKPGHRCDIAVGAPLDSKPAQATAPAAITTTPQQVISATNPTTNAPSLNIQPAAAQKNPIVINTPGTAGLNPEHGKPGHRCDIAVGAPLNSQPVAAAQPATVNATPQPTIKPTPTTLTAPPVITAPGMNPEHGKPGHRCDIAVGAPLNSKPAQ